MKKWLTVFLISLVFTFLIFPIPYCGIHYEGPSHAVCEWSPVMGPVFVFSFARPLVLGEFTSLVDGLGHLSFNISGIIVIAILSTVSYLYLEQRSLFAKMKSVGIRKVLIYLLGWVGVSLIVGGIAYFLKINEFIHLDFDDSWRWIM